MIERKLNKAFAGYHMLHLLAAVDGTFTIEEDLVIRLYMVENFPLNFSLDNEIEILSALAPEDYILHFEKCMNDFYEDSTVKERNHFMDFAVKLAKADNVLSDSENIFLKTLFDMWDNQPY